MTNDLAVLVPSRGRPHSVARLAEAFHATSTGPASLWLVVDSDEADHYRKAVDDAGLSAVGWFTLVVQTPACLAVSLNRWAPHVAHHHRYVGFMGDDHLPRTVGWDTTMIEVLDSQPHVIAYGDDLIQGPNLPTAVFMDGDIIRTLGRMVPTGMVHLYLDNAWKALGEALGTLVYRPDVVIEHMHPLVGKGVQDATYDLANAPAHWVADEARWAWYRDAGVAEDALAVKRGLLT